MSKDLNEIWAELEAKSFFELGGRKKTLPKALSSNWDMPIQAWTFVPHPDVFDHIGIPRLDRYIVTIDTISSDVYFPVLAFLEEQQANVVSYFSGGWADFVCDVRFGSDEFNRWHLELKKKLQDANAQRFCPIEELISVFQVTREHVLCREILADIGRPSQKILKEIEHDRAKFELVLRDYRSKAALAIFDNDEKEIRRYLRRLRQERAILCFRVVADFARYSHKDYVALRIENRLVDGLVKAARENNQLLRPVEDFLQVRPIHPADESEKDITHIFVNTYAYPGQRRDWKLQIYRWANPDLNAPRATTDVNLYNYPLEGTVNEAPTYLSNYPEFLERMKGYEVGAAKGVSIGLGNHPSTPGPGPQAWLPISGLAYHGLTLGVSGTGKTNTDLVLATGLMNHVTTVVILDASKGVWSKLPNEFRKAKTTNHIVANKSQRPRKILEHAVSKKGLIVIDLPKKRLADFVEAAIDFIEDQEDVVQGNQPRGKQRNVLIIEEAADAWTGKASAAKNRVQKLIRCLDKAERKGWCVWLSTQKASELGPDGELSRALLNALKNRIVHGIDNQKEEAILLDALRGENHSEADLQYVRSQIYDKQTGLAMVRGVTKNGRGPEFMPPIFVTVSLLESSAATKTE